LSQTSGSILSQANMSGQMAKVLLSSWNC
jgi:hypothetical protein